MQLEYQFVKKDTEQKRSRAIALNFDLELYPFVSLIKSQIQNTRFYAELLLNIIF